MKAMIIITSSFTRSATSPTLAYMTSQVSRENWHLPKSGTTVKFFLENLAPLQENWNPHQTARY